MHSFQFLEHTGDIKFRVCGDSMQDLFVGAACAMMVFLYGTQPSAPADAGCWEETLFMEAPDREALLVDWLSELLSLSDARGHLFNRFTFERLSDQQLQATVGAVPAAAVDDIKAVTWSELEIAHDARGWIAIVVFDI